MTDAEKVADWARLFEVSSSPAWALASCQRVDGDRVCAAVLKKLGLKEPLDVVKVMNGWMPDGAHKR